MVLVLTLQQFDEVPLARAAVESLQGDGSRCKIHARSITFIDPW